MKYTYLGVCLIMAFLSQGLSAQLQEYDYKYDLNGVENEWHKIKLTDQILEKSGNTFYTSFKVYKIGTDTLEIPYFLDKPIPSSKTKTLGYSKLNESSNENEQFITFKMNDDVTINHMQIEVTQKNYDLLVDIEGSQNNETWYKIVKDYRILSIANQSIDYEYNRVNFGSSDFKYYRLRLPKSSQNITFEQVRIEQHDEVEVEAISYGAERLEVEQDQKNQKTLVYFETQRQLPYNGFEIETEETKDYHRRFELAYLADTFTTETGFHERYKELESGIVSSLENQRYSMPKSKTTKKFRLTIYNYDNQPIDVKGLTLYRNPLGLIARFEGEGKYELIHGDSKKRYSRYDIESYKEQIPSGLMELTPTNRRRIEIANEPLKEPLVKSKKWLWLVLVAILGLLVWFATSLLKQTTDEN